MIHNGKRFFTLLFLPLHLRHSIDGRNWRCAMCSMNADALFFQTTSIKSHINISLVGRLVTRQNSDRSSWRKLRCRFEQTKLLSTKASEVSSGMFLLLTRYLFCAQRSNYRDRCLRRNRPGEKNIWVFKVNKRMNDPQCVWDSEDKLLCLPRGLRLICIATDRRVTQTM